MSYRSEGTFRLFIYESEYRQIQAWTNKHQDLETGGDLFGLWQDDRTAVVQLVVGPGKQCRRAYTSFYQDVDYLERMGDVLTLEEGLCHIGEWHSHHKLSLSRPSEGDESTIWSNMDRYGLSRFVLFIANIDTTWSWSRLSFLPDKTTVNGFLFEVDRRGYQHLRLPVLQAEFIFLQEESPFRSKYFNAIREGAESLNTAEDQLRVAVKKCQQMESGLKNVLQAKQELERSLAETKKEVHSNKQKSNKLEKSLLTERQERKKLEAYLAKEKKSHEETRRDLWNSEQTSIELDASLAVEREAREELKAALAQEQKAHEKTRRDLLNSEQRSHQLETVLAAQTHDEKTEGRLHSSEQGSHELEASLFSQTQARQETERRLHNSEQRSHELEAYLAAQIQAREETERRLHTSEQRSHELETSLAAQTQVREEAERRLHSSEQRSHELETSLAAQTQARQETESRLHSSEQRSHELETSLAAQTQVREEAERRLHSSEQRWRELETTLATVQQELEESLRSMEPCDWIVERNEISLSTREIGVGGWERVVEGIFGGCKVAVKEIHQAILSPYNRRLFEREMNIASKCRHPCLLQFIGATNDDQSPLFVTELLETSLRAVLHERPLEPTEITTIALDVAKGLNYLHLKRPAPIIHRDISSANVLLWKKGADWRAKVSDYGTANILQQTMTVSPGALIYSAPEAQTSRQSPKVDVYSFGVLLCEMNIREQPDVSQRKQQISRMTNHFHRRLIRSCFLQNSEERPSMAEIVEEIKDSERE